MKLAYEEADAEDEAEVSDNDEVIGPCEPLKGVLLGEAGGLEADSLVEIGCRLRRHRSRDE